MRKQELVHLHTLCALVRAHVEAREDVPAGAFAGYEDLDVSASAIHRSKRAHRRGVRRLSAGIASVVDSRAGPSSKDAVADGGHRARPGARPDPDPAGDAGDPL